MVQTWFSGVVFGLTIGCLGAGASGTIRYVDDSAPPGGDATSWATASNDLSATLIAALPGDEIRVGGGTYKPSAASGLNNAYFTLHDSMTLRGGYAGYGTINPDEQNPAYLTVLSGDLNGDDGPGFTNRNDNAYHVVKIAANQPSHTTPCTLDSFTIIGGNAIAGFSNQGGGVHAIGPTNITRCIFRDNFGSNAGALYLDKSCRATDCTFESNKAQYSGGAVQLSLGSTIPHEFRRCLFKNNLAANGTGGAVDLYYAYPVFIGCTFVGNQANGFGGAIKGSYYELSCINCGFFGNISTGVGGAIWVEMNGKLTGCVFSGNRSTSYAGAANGILQMINCTVANNTSGTNVGGIMGANNPIVRNCILWDNTDSQGGQGAQFGYQGTPQISYTSMQNWTGSLGGTGNNNLNPRFELAAGFDGTIGTVDDNLRLLPASPPAGSPSIDSGDNTVIPADTGDVDEDGNTAEQLPLDIDGSPRISNDSTVLPDADVVNRGAYENNHPAPHITAWRSVRTHGPLGSLAIALDPAATGNGSSGPTVESRGSGVREVQIDYSDTVLLNTPISISVTAYPTTNGALGPPINMSGAATVSMLDTNTLRIAFPSLPMPGCILIDVSNTVRDMSNNSIAGDKTCLVRNLVADLTSSGQVNLSDVVLAKTRVQAGLTPVNSPASDYNMNGVLDMADVLLVKARVLPNPQRALCP